MELVISDLDGTLLDARTYDWGAARPALGQLKEAGWPLVWATSKTRAEVEYWRDQMGITDPFIVENGGALYIPEGYFPQAPRGSRRRGGYHVIEFGRPYADVVATLAEAAEEAGCEVRGFNDVSVAELAVITRLPLRLAVMAKQREYDEPFEILSTGTSRLLEAIDRRGMRWTRGDRFYHINGGSDKAGAVERLVAAYREIYGEVHTIGVGDGHNDARFLAAVDLPVVIQSPYAVTLRQAAPHALLSRWPGARGWNDVLMRIFSAIGAHTADQPRVSATA